MYSALVIGRQLFRKALQTTPANLTLLNPLITQQRRFATDYRSANKPKPAPPVINTRVNTLITAPSVRLVENGKESRVMPTQEALKIARAANLDLVEVDHGQSPPVCRIFDYGQKRYKDKMAAREKVKATKEKQIKSKELQIGSRSDLHDFNLAMNKIKLFFEQGCHVKVTVKCLRTKIRDPVLRSQSLKDMALRIVEGAKEYAHPVQGASAEGGNLVVRLIAGKATNPNFKLFADLPEVVVPVTESAPVEDEVEIDEEELSDEE